MELCVSHYREKLDWLKESPWPVNVIHHEGGDTSSPFTPMATIPNIGCEASAYLQLIIHRWDTLPEHVAFIHGHEHAEHQKGDRPLLHMIRDAYIQKYEYIPLNNTWRLLTRSTQMIEHEEFLDVFGLGAEFPQLCVMVPYAQFIVSRNRIRSRPKEFYERLCDFVKTKDRAVSLEYVWHVIFRAYSYFPVPEDMFDPPLKRIRYFPNLPFPVREGNIKVLVLQDGEEVSDMYDGCWVVKKGGDVREGVHFMIQNDSELQNIAISIAQYNDSWIKELESSKK